MTSPAAKRLVDVEAEEVVLGSMLLSLQAVAEVREIIPSSGAFWRGAHRTVYEAVCALIDADRPVDLVTVTDELDRLGHLEGVGGTPAVSDLSAKTPSAAHASHYARIVADLHRRRVLLQHAGSVAERVQDRTVEVDDVVGEGVDLLLSAGSGADGLVTADRARAGIRDMWERGLPPGPETGWPSVDRFYRPAKGQWTILTGIPGHGKSTWLDALMVQMAVRHGWRFGVFSPENAPVHRHVAKIIACAQGRPFNPSAISEERLNRAIDWVGDHFVWIDPSEVSTLRGVLSRLQAAHARKPLDGIVIDPWNELEVPPGLNMNETLYISYALSMLRRAARKMDAHAWMVAHPTKLYKRDDGSYPVPTPYDISGSANWRNKSDFALAVYRDVTDRRNLVELHIQKVRFEENGSPGQTNLIYDPVANRYTAPGVAG